MEDLTSRIKDILEMLNLNPSQLADQIGINRSRLSHILTGRNNPSLEIIQGILKQYPQINPDWLLSGQGEFYREGNTLATDIKESEDEMEKESPTEDLFSYQRTENKQILKSQPSDLKDKPSQVIDNENSKGEKGPDQRERGKVDEMIENMHDKRVRIKLIAVLYENNEYELLYP
ncbi:MAG: helix-turn-helix transcriptional regulator [Bacteroidetes bacterium]|nr:helix-turn-helix transcriptional regulator [Bacteroidota bacterium]